MGRMIRETRGLDRIKEKPAVRIYQVQPHRRGERRVDDVWGELLLAANCRLPGVKQDSRHIDRVISEPSRGRHPT